MGKQLVAILLACALIFVLCGCIESEDKTRQKYEEAFIDGWESAMNQVDESGALGRAEEAKYYLEKGDLDEVESFLDGVISALYDVMRENPRYHLP